MEKRHAAIGCLVWMGATLMGGAVASADRTESDTGIKDYSLSAAKAVEIPARKAVLPLILYGESKGQAATFVASGYMGDATAIRLKSVIGSAPVTGGSGKDALRIQYMGRQGTKMVPKGREGWAGIYWLTPANNWGKIKGAGYNLTGARFLKFWMRGEDGGEVLADVKMGGIVGPYPDTDAAGTGQIRLTKDWQEFTIDLGGKDLRHIVGGFCFVVRRSDNPRGAIFYLDEIRFEGPAPSTATVALVEASTPIAKAPVVTVSSPAASAPVLEKSISVAVPFLSAKAAFLPAGRKILDELAETASRYAEAPLSIEGHTDSTGPADVNRRLSYQRAKAVGDYLVSKGIKRSRISLAGFGSERPIATNTTQAGRLKNRRVEVTIIAR